MQILESQELQGFTGKPKINKKSQSIKRRVDDLIQWKDDTQKRKEELHQKKQLNEYEELKKLQTLKFVNKKSEELVEKNGKTRERVDQRLMRDASIRQKKKEFA